MLQKQSALCPEHQLGTADALYHRGKSAKIKLPAQAADEVQRSPCPQRAGQQLRAEASCVPEGGQWFAFAFQRKSSLQQWWFQRCECWRAPELPPAPCREGRASVRLGVEGIWGLAGSAAAALPTLSLSALLFCLHRVQFLLSTDHGDPPHPPVL